MRYLITHYTEYRKNSIAEIKKVDEKAEAKKLTATVTVIETQLSNKEFMDKLKAIKPIFIRYIFPVQYELKLTRDKDTDLKMILDGAKKICTLKSGDKFSVQSRMVDRPEEYKSKDIEVKVGEYYENQGCIPIFSEDTLMNCDIHVISIFTKRKKCYLGYSMAEDNLNFQIDEYRVLDKEQNDICRAENKLKEAICKFNVKLQGEGNALDIGAAPGGWTKVLADYGYQVSAVDPGKLDERLSAYKNIKHYRARVEQVKFNKNFNLITCDMNEAPLITARFMCKIHNKLESNGYSIITLKLPFRDEEEEIKESLSILREDYKIISVKNLTHNRREVTVFMQNKKSA